VKGRAKSRKGLLENVRKELAMSRKGRAMRRARARKGLAMKRKGLLEDMREELVM
jgi:hypothetical protein